MITLELGKHRRARIWTEELPVIPIAIDRVISLSMPVVRNALAMPKVAAVEVVVPLGARTMYGLLGGSMTPVYGNTISIDVALTDYNGKLLFDTLAPPGEEVRAGLPREFSGAVLDAITLAQQTMPDLLPLAKLLTRPLLDLNALRRIGQGISYILSASVH